MSCAESALGALLLACAVSTAFGGAADAPGPPLAAHRQTLLRGHGYFSPPTKDLPAFWMTCSPV